MDVRFVSSTLDYPIIDVLMNFKKNFFWDHKSPPLPVLLYVENIDYEMFFPECLSLLPSILFSKNPKRKQNSTHLIPLRPNGHRGRRQAQRDGQQAGTSVAEAAHIENEHPKVGRAVLRGEKI
jgi:hypothetical protein